MVIREARVEDVEAILRIYADSGIEGEERFGAEEAAAHLESFRAYPSYKVYVAMVGEAVVGTYALLLMDNLAKRGRRSGIVEDVGVTPERQSQGIGRAMMTHATGLCREAKCYKLMLSSNGNRTKAHALYESLGFERHGYSFALPIE